MPVAQVFTFLLKFKVYVYDKMGKPTHVPVMPKTSALSVIALVSETSDISTLSKYAIIKSMKNSKNGKVE